MVIINDQIRNLSILRFSQQRNGNYKNKEENSRTKNIVSEIKNSPAGLNSRLEKTEYS